MKVLIITYYWPPAGGSGVQRWLKFVKYFRNFGIEPVIYTVENPNYALEDESLLKDIPDGIEVLRQPIWEPNNLMGNKKQTSAGFLNSSPSLVGKVLQYIRANYFIPDARKYWIKPSVEFLSEYLEKNQIDVVISTGPPHSMHLIGLGLKKKLGIKWISDFRDPWTEIDYFHQLPLTEKSIKKHQKLEQEVLENSDSVIVVGETMKQNFSTFNSNIHVITNGYDTELKTESVELDKKFSLTHIGLMNEDRNPSVLWKVLSEIAVSNKNFSSDLEIKLIGKVSKVCLDELDNNNLGKNLNLIDYLAHNEVQLHQRSAQVLLLAINDVPSAKGIITGKIFEYLVAKRPILAIGPVDGDLAQILNDTDSGVIIDFKNAVSLKSTILELYKKYKNESLKVNSKNIEQFHRKNLTEKLSKLIKAI
ncbi:MAG: glycosyltransferase family 4 protein [Flavobacteriaceae bacterium]|nr:glycosyltransferase family 4 protein [Flavobacteriaceae bacterium]